MGTSIRESLWLFPIIETVHIFGIILLVGATSILDLRLMGLDVSRRVRFQAGRRFLPWAWAGFLIQVITGLLLFSSEATKMYGNLGFDIKMLLILVAGINAFVFHSSRLPERRQVGQRSGGAAQCPRGGIDFDPAVVRNCRRGPLDRLRLNVGHGFSLSGSRVPAWRRLTTELKPACGSQPLTARKRWIRVPSIRLAAGRRRAPRRARTRRKGQPQRRHGPVSGLVDQVSANRRE